jgi:biotin synthase-related radical SAM superfamily protein
VRARYIARNRQPEASPSLVLISRIVEPEKRLEHFLAQIRRDAGAVVVDRDSKISMVAVTDDSDRRRKARRV